MNYFFKCFKQYADFKGRARRREYFIFNVVNNIILAALLFFIDKNSYLSSSAIDRYLGNDSGISYEGIFSSNLSLFLFILYMVYFCAIFIPSLAVSVRRMHDVGYSGWWILLQYIPIVFSCLYP